jgi:hypothetical protein
MTARATGKLKAYPPRLDVPMGAYPVLATSATHVSPAVMDVDHIYASKDGSLCAFNRHIPELLPSVAVAAPHNTHAHDISRAVRNAQAVQVL